MCGNRLALCQRLRVHVDHRIGKYTTRDVLEDPWLEYVDTGEHQRRLTATIDNGHATESGDATRFSIYHAEPFTTSVGQKNKCRDRIHLAMRIERGVQIDVSDDLTVDDDERLVFEEGARVVERAAGAEYHRLF